jgi:hypothetical protein
MVLATKLLPNSVSAVYLKTLQTTVTKRQWQGFVFSLVSYVPYLPTVTTACDSFGAKGKSYASSQSMQNGPEDVQVGRVD